MDRIKRRDGCGGSSPSAYFWYSHGYYLTGTIPNSMELMQGQKSNSSYLFLCMVRSSITEEPGHVDNVKQSPRKILGGYNATLTIVEFFKPLAVRPSSFSIGQTLQPIIP